jgi:hypothetical protein
MKQYKAGTLFSFIEPRSYYEGEEEDTTFILLVSSRKEGSNIGYTFYDTAIENYYNLAATDLEWKLAQGYWILEDESENL